MPHDFPSDYSSLALNTATLGHNIENKGAGLNPFQVIDVCSSKGIRGITFWAREFPSLSIAHKTAQHAKDCNIDIIGLCRTPYLIGPEAPRTDESIKSELTKTLDLASTLEAKVVTIVVGGIDTNRGSIQNNLARVTDVVSNHTALAKNAGTKLALEPLNPVYCGNRSCLTTVRDAINIVNTINHSHVGLAIDIYHVWWDTSLKSELSRIKGKGKIFGFHLCDWLRETNDILFDRGMMGDGVADIQGIRKIVEETGYDGYCEVEIFSEQNWWKKEPEQVLDVVIERFCSVC
ncbi:MAG: sugar phosphate isomerase/epimerase [Rhodobacteraceae bacterium]|nr:sugar phosphate isomerase/epimerase [Paracoccaceae bacterium]